jgi:hypothetical protein
VREGQKREWVREKDRERKERRGGGQEPQGETHIQNPKKQALTFSVTS